MLRIANLEFAVVNCRLEAYCSEETMKWDIEVECAPHAAGRFHGHAPTLSLSLFETSPKAFRHWTALAPRATHWVERNDTDVTPSGMLYIFEHTPIFECHARLHADHAGMRVELHGTCDVQFDEDYDVGLDLRLDASVVFQGIWFGRQPEAECRAELARFLDSDDFAFSPTEHGVSVMTPKRSA